MPAGVFCWTRFSASVQIQSPRLFFERGPSTSTSKGFFLSWNKWFRRGSEGSNHAVLRQGSFQQSSQFVLLTKLLGFTRRLRDGASNAAAGDTNTLMMRVGKSKVLVRWQERSRTCEGKTDERAMGAGRDFDPVPGFGKNAGRVLSPGVRAGHGVHGCGRRTARRRALVAAVSCWISVTLFFFSRHTSTICVSIAAIVALLAYKIAAIGW